MAGPHPGPTATRDRSPRADRAGWLVAADKYGRRRIDDPTDWVRNEIAEALQRRIPIVPVAITHTANLPDNAGLPDALQGLPLAQAKVLRLEPSEWAGDVRTLANVLVDYDFVQERPPAQPPGSAKIARMPPLTRAQPDAALAELPEWEEWQDTLPTEYPHARQELRRTFTFTDFREAIEFMTAVAPEFENTRPHHHPRWSNEWNTVRIRLTTWDAKNTITELDVKTAKIVDAAYRKFIRSRQHA